MPFKLEVSEKPVTILPEVGHVQSSRSSSISGTRPDSTRGAGLIAATGGIAGTGEGMGVDAPDDEPCEGDPAEAGALALDGAGAAGAVVAPCGAAFARASAAAGATVCCTCASACSE